MINTASLDGRQRLVLVRRDNVEHLLLIGGPTDVVIEPNIDRTAAAASAPTPERETNASPPPKPPLRQTLSLEGLGLPPSEPVYVEPPPPRPVREAIPPEAMVREGVTREQIPREAMIREAISGGRNGTGVVW